jgi:biotin carboxyl carrier protein
VSGFRQRLVIGDTEIDVDVVIDDGTLTGTVGLDGSEHPVEVHVERAGAHCIRVRTASEVLKATVFRDGDLRYVAIDGDVYVVRDAGSERAADASGADAMLATSPMTGLVVKIHVSPGDAVGEDQPLFVIEAMKMEYVVRAPRDVVVADVNAVPGQSVELGEALVTFVADEA